MGGFRPYPNYKPSGVTWLGKLPAHWAEQRLGVLAEMRVSNVDKHSNEGELPVRLCNYVDVYKNDRIEPSMSFMKATASPEEVNRFRLKKDDVLITKDSESWADIGVPALRLPLGSSQGWQPNFRPLPSLGLEKQVCELPVPRSSQRRHPLRPHP